MNEDFSKYVPKDLQSQITQAMGAASMCWESPEKAGYFKSSAALRIADNVIQIVGEQLMKEKNTPRAA